MKELLKKLLEYFSHPDYHPRGLCATIWDMNWNNIITFKEENKLCDYIRDNTKNISCFVYKWPKYEKLPRIKWLKNEINKL